jgi:hypothetical protein
MISDSFLPIVSVRAMAGFAGHPVESIPVSVSL